MQLLFEDRQIEVLAQSFNLNPQKNEKCSGDLEDQDLQNYSWNPKFGRTLILQF